MAAMEIYGGTYEMLEYDLPAAIESYKAELVAFAKTVDVPAPVAIALVEQIVKEHGGEFVILPPLPPRYPKPLPSDPKYYRSLAERDECIEASGVVQQAKIEAKQRADRGGA